MTLVALVPMRHNSERVPGKNYRHFGDAPLFHHVVRTLLAVEAIDEIIIDTDSPVVSGQCADLFPSVRIIDRPEHLRDGAIPMNTIIEHDLGFTDAAMVLQTHSTNPLLKPDTVSDALARFAADVEADSLFSVTRLQARLWGPGARPLNHDPAVLLRTQDLEPVYLENSCLYVFPRELILEHGSRIGARPLLFEIDPLEALDIDEEPDFLLAEAQWKIAHGWVK